MIDLLNWAKIVYSICTSAFLLFTGTWRFINTCFIIYCTGTVVVYQFCSYTRTVVAYHIFTYTEYYSYACFVSLPDEDWYIQSKICLLNLTQLDSCLVQNMTLNTDYSAVDAPFKVHSMLTYVQYVIQSLYGVCMYKYEYSYECTSVTNYL